MARVWRSKASFSNSEIAECFRSVSGFAPDLVPDMLIRTRGTFKCNRPQLHCEPYPPALSKLALHQKMLTGECQCTLQWPKQLDKCWKKRRNYHQIVCTRDVLSCKRLKKKGKQKQRSSRNVTQKLKGDPTARKSDRQIRRKLTSKAVRERLSLARSAV